MSKNIKNTTDKVKDFDIEKEVMSRVASGEITMKPRWYFVAGSIFMFLGTIASAVVAVFLINLTIFIIKKNGPGYRKLDMMFDNFPFWIPILAILGIGIGIFMLRKYDFSYKKNFNAMIAGFIASIIIAGFLVNYLGLNEIWSIKGPMRGFYRQIEKHESDFPGSPSVRNGQGNGNGRK